METIAIILAVIQVIIFYKWFVRAIEMDTDYLWIEPSIIAVFIILQILLLN